MGILWFATAKDTANGTADVVIAGIPGDEATIKTFRRRNGAIVLVPSNEQLTDMVFDPAEVNVYGKVVTVMRKL